MITANVPLLQLDTATKAVIVRAKALRLLLANDAPADQLQAARVALSDATADLLSIRSGHGR